MVEPDPQMELIFSFYEGLERKGPGSDESTLKALWMLAELSDTPRIVDFGCGGGAASIALAGAIPCHMTAVDIHEPFLAEVEAAATCKGLEHRIATLAADMADPPFDDHSLDLVWSEGAIYNIGFEAGLKRWRRLLRSGGFVAVTEITWLSDNPPQEVADFWKSEYPDITTIDGNLKRLQSAGYERVGHFVLPRVDWENYYGPLEQHLAAFRVQHADNAEGQMLLEMTGHEIDMWNRYGTSYGYVFYLGKSVFQNREK